MREILNTLFLCLIIAICITGGLAGCMAFYDKVHGFMYEGQEPELETVVFFSKEGTPVSKSCPPFKRYTKESLHLCLTEDALLSVKEMKGKVIVYHAPM